jgi:ABC-type lipoprotein release transport system permease subunit
LFEPLVQNPSRLATLLVRTSGDDPLRLFGSIEAAVHRVEKYAPVYGVTTLSERLAGFLTQRRFQTWLLIAFSVVALIIAAVGIYGLIQYSVAMRGREIGIRIAVGAQTGQIFRMIIGEALRLSLTGLALGLAAALWVSRALAGLLFGVSAADPLTLATVSALLIVVGFAGSYLPARRAMQIDPIVTLRQE